MPKSLEQLEDEWNNEIGELYGAVTSLLAAAEETLGTTAIHEMLKDLKREWGERKVVTGSIEHEVLKAKSLRMM